MRQIVVAEDTVKVREMIEQTLREAGYEALCVGNGLDAIRSAMAHRPPVLLLDGLLPQMHGFDVARYINQVDGHYHPEIILMTAIYKTNAYRNDAKLRCGITRFLTKPFTSKQLLYELDEAWTAAMERSPEASAAMAISA